MEYPVSDEEGAEDEEDAFMVGPPPPEIAEELDLGEGLGGCDREGNRLGWG